MSIDSMSGIGSTATSSTAAASASSIDPEATKNQFLSLLITQLKNQDPLSPADSSEMTSQMMQMGQLEQMVNLNKTMDSFYNLEQGGQIAQYSSMVGKNVLATGNQFQVTQTDAGSVNFTISSVPKEAELRIFDKFGNLVRQMPIEELTVGANTVAFDGLNSAGKPVEVGYYSYQVEATDTDDNAVPVTTYSTGQISGIRLENGIPIFQMGNTDLLTTDIKRVF